MIIGTHAIIYSAEPDLLRALLSTVLEEFATIDGGGGWQIVALPPAELAVHPGEPGDAGRCELHLQCDDVAATVEALTGKGVRFAGPITDQGWGLATSIELPGGGSLGLYQPRHHLTHDLPRPGASPG